MNRQVVVLAGGLGTRVASLTGDTLPKALLDVAGRPFIDRKLEELRDQGATRVLLLTGHASAVLRDHFARTRPVLPVEIVEDGPTLLGTAGAVRAALDHLDDRFWLTYGDTFLDVPIAAVEADLDTAGAAGSMTVLHNRDRWQPSNTSVSGGWVVGYGKGAPPGTHEWIDYGMLLFRRSVFERLPDGFRGDLGLVVQELVAERALRAVAVTEPFHDIGTPEALAETAARFTGR